MFNLGHKEAENMKKICYITTVSSTVKAFFLATIDKLCKNDYQVTVICDYDLKLEELLPRGVHYMPVHMERGISIKNGITAVWRLYKIFRQEKFDLIQYCTPNAAFYSSIAGKLAGVKIRLYHNMGFVFLSYHGLKRTIFLLLEKITCRLSDKVQFASKSNLSLALENRLTTENKAYVVWNGSSGGVDLERFNISKKNEYRSQSREMYGIKDNDFIFGFVGRLTKDKGIEELFSAFWQIRKDCKYRDYVKLLVVGPIENLSSIDKKLLNDIQRDPHVIFCGIQSEIEKFYSAMDVLVLPSYREGFGNVIIEAGAMGIPVIASDIPGPSDIVWHGETGLLCKPKDAKDLERCMRVMLDYVDLRMEYSLKGAKYASANYDSKILTERILEDKNNLLHNICK